MSGSIRVQSGDTAGADIARIRAAAVTAGLTDTGNPVTNGTNLQAAITAAAAGDTLVLAAGVEYRGNFTMPNKAGSSYITIRTSSALPTRRIQEGDAALLPKLTADSGVITTFATPSHHWRFQGIEWKNATSCLTSGSYVNYAIADDEGATWNDWPTYLEFDRCLVHPQEVDPIPYRGMDTGVNLNGAYITFKHSRVYNFCGVQPPANDAARNLITGATQAATCVVTFTDTITYPDSAGTNTGHYTFGYFTGGTGDWTGLNGLKLLKYLTDTTAEVYNVTWGDFTDTALNTSAYAAYTGQSVRMGKILGTNTPGGGVGDVYLGNRAFNLITGPGPYTFTNTFIEAQYCNFFFGGGTNTPIPTGNVVTVTSVPAIDKIRVSGLGDLQVGDTLTIGRMASQGVSAATQASPTELTVPTHRYPLGSKIGPASDLSEGSVLISGATGAWTGLNGNWQGTVTGTNTFTVPFYGVGLGPLTGTVVWTWQSKGLLYSQRGWANGRVTAIDRDTNEITYDFLGNPSGGNGNGAGIPAAADAPAAYVQFNGAVVDGVTVSKCVLSFRRSWFRLWWQICRKAHRAQSTGTKGILEAKSATNVSFDACVIRSTEGALETEAVASIGLNQASQGGNTPWSVVSNWTITNCLFRHVPFGLWQLHEEYQSPAAAGGNVTVSNCVFTKTNLARWASLHGYVSGESFSHCTVRNFDGGDENQFIRDVNGVDTATVHACVGQAGLYGLSAAAMTKTNNYLIDNKNLGAGEYFPTGVNRVATEADMHFTNVAAADADDGDWTGLTLTSESPAYGVAGADMAVLAAAINGVEDD